MKILGYLETHTKHIMKIPAGYVLLMDIKSFQKHAHCILA